MSRAKMVIVIRTDLVNYKSGKPVSVGKLCSQACHAVLGAFLQMLSVRTSKAGIMLIEGVFKDISALASWINGSFFKIVLRVDSEGELLELYSKAKEAGLNVCLITDNGHTEFDGNKTHTCLAIGVDWEENINPITGHLKLL